MIKFKNPLIIILLISFFLISTCATDNSVTGSYDQYLGKTNGVVDINSPISDDEDLIPVQIYMNYLGAWILDYYWEMLEKELIFRCLSLFVSVASTQEKDDPGELCKSYDFRDNYLSKSEKGEVYTACYYLLSVYGIENNLVNQYYREHHELINSSVKIAYQLQYGSSNDQILIKKDIAEKLEYMLRVYRNHENHRDIDPVLDYLEYDLNKYQNKSKSAIATDFE